MTFTKNIFAKSVFASIVAFLVCLTSASFAADYTIKASNFFDATGHSTNGKYVVAGIVAKDDGSGTIIIKFDGTNFKNATEATFTLTNEDGSFRSVVYDYSNNTVTYSDGTTVQRTSTEVSQMLRYKTIDVELPDRTVSLTSSASFVTVPIDNLSEIAQVFLVNVTTRAGGFSVNGMEVVVDLNYSISKTCDKSVAVYGDELTYFVTVKNEGSVGFHADVYDVISTDQVIITSVDGEPATQDATGRVNLLPDNAYLPAGFEQTFVLTGVVNYTGVNYSVLNTAYIAGPTVPKMAYAETYCNPGFSVVHQSNPTKPEYIPMYALGDSATFDVTVPLTNAATGEVCYSGVPAGYLYGGLYVDGEMNDMRTDVCGVRLVPEVGDVYYVKEVSDNYLRAKTLTKSSNGVINALMVMDVDSTDYEDVGFLFNDEPLASSWDKVLYSNITYKAVNRATQDETSYSQSVQSAFGLSGAWFPYAFSSDEMASMIGGGANTILPYWVTPDNVKVTSAYSRSLEFASDLKTLSNSNVIVNDTFVGSTTSEETRPLLAPAFKLASNFLFSNTCYTITKNYGNYWEDENVAGGDCVGLLTASEKAGYVFAGWFADPSFNVPADLSNVQSDMVVYAKYVDEDYMKLAFWKTTTRNVVTKIRLTAAVAGANLEQGFVVSVNGSEATFPVSKLNSSVNNYTASTLYGIDASAKLYYYDLNVKGLAKGSTIAVTPYWITADGSTVYGSTRDLIYNTKTID